MQHGNSVSLERVQKSLNKNGVALKGVINVPEFGRAGELLSLNQKFRNTNDLYANVVKVESLPGVKSRHTNIDFVIVREQTEGEYSALEHESVPGVVECLKVVTAEKSLRIAKVIGRTICKGTLDYSNQTYPKGNPFTINLIHEYKMDFIISPIL